MSQHPKHEYFQMIYARYRLAGATQKERYSLNSAAFVASTGNMPFANPIYICSIRHGANRQYRGLTNKTKPFTFLRGSEKPPVIPGHSM